MLIFRYDALFSLLFVVILNCETASLLRGGVVGTLGSAVMDAGVGRAHVVGMVLWGGTAYVLDKWIAGLTRSGLALEHHRLS